MAYWQWGAASSRRVLVCVHGLTRQGRDFDELARVLLARAGGDIRIVCPDVVGRGQSDWLREPMDYQVPTYAADMLGLVAHLHAQAPIATLDYLGTSMGGLIGIAIAGSPQLPLPVPVRRLVLNDVGPTINPEAIARIGSYVGKIGRYASVEEAADAMWALSTTFGAHTREQWMALSRPMVVPASQRTDDGSAKRLPPEGEQQMGGPVVLHYDPAVAVPIRAITPELAAQAEAATWALYDAITARTLLIRGAESDLLSRATAQDMTQRGPHAELIEFAGVGHAPTFVAPEQSHAVAAFLFD
jgi:pimeloyl-ACP methyl ester carboxylesterase